MSSISIIFDRILEDGFEFLSFLRVLLSPYLSVVYIGQLFKRLLIISISLVSFTSKFSTAIIPPLITEAYPGDIEVLVSYKNSSSISLNGLEYVILRTWCAWLYLA